MSYANNKGTDQPVLLRSLISAFDVHCLDYTIPILDKFILSRLKLAFPAEQAGLSLSWSKPPKAGFLVTWLNTIFQGIDDVPSTDDSPVLAS